MPSFTLDNTLRLQILARMSLPTIDNSPFYHSASTPYFFVDEAIKEATQEIIQELSARNCQNALIEITPSYTWPADTQSRTWTQIIAGLSFGTAVAYSPPGARVLKIKDVTDPDQPVYINMVDANSRDKVDPTLAYGAQRRMDSSGNWGSTYAVLSGDSIALYPKQSSTRVVQFEYVPLIEASGGLVCLPMEAKYALINLTAALLLRSKDRDTTGLDQSYQQHLMSTISSLQTGRSTLRKVRGRYEGPR